MNIVAKDHVFILPPGSPTMTAERFLVLDTQQLPEAFETEDGDLYIRGHVDPIDAAAAGLLYELSTMGLKEVAANGLIEVADVKHSWWVVPESDGDDVRWIQADATTPGAEAWTVVTR